MRFVISLLLVIVAMSPGTATLATEPANAPATPELETADVQSQHTCDELTEKQRLFQHKLSELRCLQQEIEDLRSTIGFPTHVVVGVKMIEVNRTNLHRLGVDFSTVDNSAGHPLEPGTQTLYDVPISFFDSLCELGLAKVIASPMVLATTDQSEAEFFEGGEVPVPIPDGRGNEERKRFGTEVKVKVKALGANRVNLCVNPRISEINDSKSVTMNGVKIPDFRVRQCSFDRDIELGDTTVVSGGVQKRASRDQPRNGQRPRDEEEVELVMIVQAVAVE